MSSIKLFTNMESHLLQMRGLKLDSYKWRYHSRGRIFYRCVDWNWIDKNNRMQAFSRIFYRCVDWNTVTEVSDKILGQSHLLQMRGLKQWSTCQLRLYYSRIFYRCVDWNNRSANSDSDQYGRIFYRCVDWNKACVNRVKAISVASFTDAWIETKNDL